MKTREPPAGMQASARLSGTEIREHITTAKPVHARDRAARCSSETIPAGGMLMDIPIPFWYSIPHMAQGIAQPNIETLFEAGAHFGRSKSRRHPSAEPFIFGVKDKNDIFDLTQTAVCLARALEAVAKVAGEGKQILFVGGKDEVASLVKNAALRIGVPYVAGRWIGGTLTNFKQIRRRIDRLNKLTGEKERGELEKYTKRERLLIDREIEELEHRFRGIADLEVRPGMVFIVDTRHEATAVAEAIQMKIPVVGLANSDCDINGIAYPIPANDSSTKSVAYFVNTFADAYWYNKKSTPAESPKRTK